MAADALSDVLKTVRLTGATFFDVVAKAPWVAESLPQEMILPKILPGAEHLIAYHVVTEGRCFANIIGEEPIAIEAGEVIVFTKGDSHVLSSSPGMRAGPVAPGKLEGITASQLPFLLNYGGDGPTSAKFVCGYLACDARPFNPLLDNLPPVIKAGNKQGSVPTRSAKRSASTERDSPASLASSSMVKLYAGLSIIATDELAKPAKKVVGMPPSAWRRRLGHDESRPL